MSSPGRLVGQTLSSIISGPPRNDVLWDSSSIRRPEPTGASLSPQRLSKLVSRATLKFSPRGVRDFTPSAFPPSAPLSCVSRFFRASRARVRRYRDGGKRVVNLFLPFFYFLFPLVLGGRARCSDFVADGSKSRRMHRSFAERRLSGRRGRGRERRDFKRGNIWQLQVAESSRRREVAREKHHWRWGPSVVRLASSVFSFILIMKDGSR